MGYFPVHLKTIRPDEEVDFDIHLLLSKDEGRYVHYLRRADVFDGDRLARLREKGVKKVYIGEDEETLYLDYLDRGLAALEGDAMSTNEKAALVRDTLGTQAENAEHALETENGFDRMQGQLGKVTAFFTGDKGALKGILSEFGVSTDVSQHSANVASLSLGVATLAGLTGEQDLLDLGIACLVHDIGSKKLGFGPTDHAETLEGAALEKFKKHPAESVGALAGKKFITPRVLALVADHEEIGEGRGYPERKRIDKLHPTSQVLNMCNAFDRFCMVRGLTARQGIDGFYEDYEDRVVLSHLSILASVVTAG